MQPLTTGIPWVDRALAIIAGAVTICSFLAHYIPPSSTLGKLISFVALNGGKLLVKQDTATLPPPRGFARLGLLVVLAGAGLLLSGCASWSVAMRASPACYGLTPTKWAQVIADGKAIVLDAAKVGVAGAEAALAQYLADQQLDDQAALCVEQTIANEIRYPNGGEPAYTPQDAGPAPSALAMGGSLRTAAESNALTALFNLQSRGGK